MMMFSDLYERSEWQLWGDGTPSIDSSRAISFVRDTIGMELVGRIDVGIGDPLDINVCRSRFAVKILSRAAEVAQV